jgi:hypothetical protein
MLTKKVAITLPGTDHGKPVEDSVIANLVNLTMRMLSRWFGGCTALEAKGAWVSESSGQLVAEPVVIVYSYCDDEALAKHRKDVEGWAAQVATQLGQECVAVEWPEGLDFIKGAYGILPAGEAHPKGIFGLTGIADEAA